MYRILAIGAIVMGGGSFLLFAPRWRTSIEDIRVPLAEMSNEEARVREVIDAARNRVQQEKSSGAAWGELGIVFHAHDYYEEAVESYQRAADLDPDEFRWTYFLAIAQEKLDPEAATPHFEAAMRMRPNDAAVCVRLGDALARVGECAAAEKLYRRALQNDPHCSLAHFGLARLALETGQLEQAEAHLAPVSRSPDGPVQALLAQVYHRLGEAELARQATVLAQAHPGRKSLDDPTFREVAVKAVSSHAHNRRGLAHAEAGRYVEAEEEFRRVLEIRGENTHDYKNLAGALRGQQKFKEALEIYRQALRLDPDDPEALSSMALALIGLNRMQEALAELRRALDIDPGSAEAYYHLGMALDRLGRHDHAVRSYRKALQLNPTLGWVHYDLGKALAAQDQFEGALDHWQQAVYYNPLEIEPRYNLAIALSRSGRHRESVDELRRALEVAPNQTAVVRFLAWELATAPDEALRDGGEALALAQHVYRQDPRDLVASDVLAAAFAESGRFREAHDLARRAFQQATEMGQLRLARQIRSRCELYQKSKPFHQSR